VFPEISEIKRRRKLLGVSQKDLAGMAGVSRPSLNKLEAGGSDLSYSKVKSIFEALERVERGPGSWMLLTGRLRDFHSQPIEFVSVGETVQMVCRRMIETDFSQFPVKDGDRIVGSISEWGVNRAICELGRGAVDARVGDVLENPFPVFGVESRVQSVIAVLRGVQAVLTVDEGVVVGIVTNQDLYKRLV